MISERSIAQTVNHDMGLGFNLGNSFDAIPRPESGLKGNDSEIAWHNPRTTKEMIAAIRRAGFKTLRLPVSWHIHVSDVMEADGLVSRDIVAPEWMKRVREVVDWCMDEGLYVILNTHHDIREGFLLPDNAHIDRADEFMRNIWRQIAVEFGSYPHDRLLFESMNEIRIPGADYEWTPDYSVKECREAMENVNRLNQTFTDTVRAAGRENVERVLIIPGYSTSTEGVCWDGFRLPRDTEPGRMIVAAHIYSPAHFVFLVKDREDIREFDINSPASTDPIDERLGKLYERFVKNGIPVNVDEFGTVDKDNDPHRIACLAYTLYKGSGLGIRFCYWDNGVFKWYGNGMAIFDRNSCSFPDPTPVRVMLEGLSGTLAGAWTEK